MALSVSKPRGITITKADSEIRQKDVVEYRHPEPHQKDKMYMVFGIFASTCVIVCTEDDLSFPNKIRVNKKYLKKI